MIVQFWSNDVPIILRALVKTPLQTQTSVKCVSSELNEYIGLDSLHLEHSTKAKNVAVAPTYLNLLVRYEIMTLKFFYFHSMDYQTLNLFSVNTR